MKRITISGTLLAETGLHIGGAHSGAGVDMIVSVDATGTPIIPGTALTGALRGVLDAGRTRIDRWGDAEDVGASSISIGDCALEGVLSLDIRDGVSISRFWGAAVDGMLYNREVLPAGSTFGFRARVRTSEHRDADCACAACDLTRALTSGIQVGSGATTGLGRIRLDQPMIAVVEMSRKGMEGLLAGGPTAVEWKGRASDEVALPRVEIGWRPIGPVMSKVSLEGRAFDAIPRTVQIDKKVHLLLPGSSIKGSLRAQSEKIVNTVMGPVDDIDLLPERTAEAQLEWLDTAARRRHRGAGPEDPAGEWGPIGLLYGAVATGRKAAGGRRGAVLVDDVTSARAVHVGEWAELMDLALKGKGSDTQMLAGKAHSLGFKVTTRVAIDRWTGGAADHLLYTSLDPYFTADGDWAPITLRLDVHRLGDPDGDDAQAALGLLWLTINDLRLGRFGLGFGQTRGYGAISIGAVAAAGFPGGEWPPEFPAAWIGALKRVLTGPGGEES